MAEEKTERTGTPLQGRCCCGSLHLTHREVELICVLAAGATTTTAATRLNISPHTVAHHVGQMLQRIAASSRTELIARAYAGGVLVAGSWPPAASGKYCLDVQPAV